MIEMVEAACAVPTTMQGRILEDVSRNVDAETVRQPVGVCAAIVPFNFPAMVPFWFLPVRDRLRQQLHPQALRAGAADPADRLRVLDGLDLPPGVVNLVNGGREVVEGILDHPGIDASRSSARRRSRASSTSAPPSPASASRRWAAPRTTWS